MNPDFFYGNKQKVLDEFEGKNNKDNIFFQYQKQIDVYGFGFFPLKDFVKNLQQLELSELRYHEGIFPNVKTRLVIDFEQEKTKKEEGDVRLGNICDEVENRLKSIALKLNEKNDQRIEFNLEKIVLDACILNKYSVHIIYPQIIFEDTVCLYNFLDGIDSVDRLWIPISNLNKFLRLPYNQKLGKSNWLIPRNTENAELFNPRIFKKCLAQKYIPDLSYVIENEIVSSLFGQTKSKIYKSLKKQRLMEWGEDEVLLNYLRLYYDPDLMIKEITKDNQEGWQIQVSNVLFCEKGKKFHDRHYTYFGKTKTNYIYKRCPSCKNTEIILDDGLIYL